MPIYGAAKFGPVLEQRYQIVSGSAYETTIRQYGKGRAIQNFVKSSFGREIITEVTPDYSARITKDAKSIYTIVTDTKNNAVVAQDAHISYKPKDMLTTVVRLLTGTAKSEDIPFFYSERFRRHPDGSTSKFTISSLGTRKLVMTDKNNVEIVKQRSAIMVALRKWWRGVCM